MYKQDEAIEWVRDRATSMLNKGLYPTGIEFEVIVVWAGYILGNEKYLITTSLPDGKFW